MRITVNRSTVQILKAFGDINTVTDKILDYCEASGNAFEDMPPVMLEDPTKINIEVTNSTFLQLLSVYGSRNNKISLARVLEWFVTNEEYINLGWSLNSKPVLKSNNKMRSKILKIKSDILSLALEVGDDDYDDLAKMQLLLNNLEKKYGLQQSDESNS